ncbi:uncharacterized protein ACJ7VT_017526 [Polymixia lowei]
MKTQSRLFFLLAVVTLLVKAQTPVEPNYDDFVLNLEQSLLNFRPLLDSVQVETLYPDYVDLSKVSFRRLTLTAQETDCSADDDAIQGQRKLCPLKENGRLQLCKITVLYPVQEVQNIVNLEMECNPAEEDALLKKVRTRRSRGGRGSSRGGGSRGSSRGGGSRGSSRGGGSRGSSRGGGSKGSRGGRTGGGSSIAGRGNRGNGGTQTA